MTPSSIIFDDIPFRPSSTCSDDIQWDVYIGFYVPVILMKNRIDSIHWCTNSNHPLARKIREFLLRLSREELLFLQILQAWAVRRLREHPKDREHACLGFVRRLLEDNTNLGITIASYVRMPTADSLVNMAREKHILSLSYLRLIMMTTLDWEDRINGFYKC
jgi:hypothetical protein